MIWYAILIPLALSFIAWFYNRKQFVLWEVFLPTLVTAVVIIISYYTMKGVSLSDVEYNGYLVTEARHYEAYETYVHQTCTRQVACGTYTTTSNGQTTTHTQYCTETYDCSYCDSTPEKYIMYDTGGNEIRISREKFYALMYKWKAKAEFVELNRDIEYYGGCGKDGDMYRIIWDERIESSETTTYTNHFTNILKCNHSAFNFPVITEDEAKKQGLYDYPEIVGDNSQKSVLGLDSISYKYKKYFQTKLSYLNGNLGYRHKVRVFTLIFKDKDINTAFLQEAYWDGGNQNELVVCIGVDKAGKLNWVKPFTWCDNKRMIVDTREDIMALETLNPDGIYNVYENNITKYWKHKSFKDFNYLSFEPTTGQLIFIYVFATLISVGFIYWCATNEHRNEED